MADVEQFFRWAERKAEASLRGSDRMKCMEALAELRDLYYTRPSGSAPVGERMEEEVTHIMKGGNAACGFSKERPVDWPPGHFWISQKGLEDYQAEHDGAAPRSICLRCHERTSR